MYKHTLNLIKNKILVYITMEELKGIQSLTPLSRAFFSKQNISSLHTNIRYQVWLDTNKQHVISAQSNEELILIMRSIYLQNSSFYCFTSVRNFNRFWRCIDFYLNLIIAIGHVWD